MITTPIKQEIIDLTDDLDDIQSTSNVPTNTTMHMIPITNYGYGSYFNDIEQSPMKNMKVESASWEQPQSNATSHKWALGAFAELLDNTMDEVCNDATYVSVDVLDNKKDKGSKMLLVEDNGGGMTHDRMRQCMSLGYSAKSKLANTIGQYGNGFKTSSMRLGADVIVFSRGTDRATSTWTQSVGMIVLYFFNEHGKEDIVVPMVDFVKRGDTWEMRPPGFRIILRGKDVKHHNLVNDVMLSEEITYRPQSIGYENSAAEVTIGFVKDAKHHIDIQGFNVYHKNRLIKPFWRVWNAAGSDGRGVIGVLDANFVEPAHDKQGFERTIVLARLEARLQAMQKKYWSSNCHFIGYAKRRNVKNSTVSPDEKESNTCSAHTSNSCSPFTSNVGPTTSGVEREMGPVHSSMKDSSAVQEASRVYVKSKLKDASVTIQELLNKVRLIESSRINFTCKNEC
ncbi:hypothetical protein RND71_004092 [Anisodus tanguticus]|uniref:Morc S5 domain-containing protein n=1 Tax=Anisodus tanguticus TaxID=243964 RepID=A0AAE1SZZ4_9SOLA|nr:hypothetical protein RND71_004092 [Anisodus tanguticus]